MIDYESIQVIAYFNLLKTGSWIEENIKAILKPLGLTHPQLNILHILNDNYSKPISASELKEKLIVNSPDLTRLLDRLVKQKWVVRETCPDNRRKIDIYLTNDGKLVFKKAQTTLNDFMGSIFNKITDIEASELRKILHKMRE